MFLELYDPVARPFGQCYYSITNPGVARDEMQWHVHAKQEHRFIVAQGGIILALFDARYGSSTSGRLNLSELAESEGPDNQFVVLVPRNVYHAFLSFANTPSVLINIPTRLYDASDEGRVPFGKACSRFSTREAFSWDLVRHHLDSL